jgi:uncharacterized phosphosugar-binding protein
MLENHSTRTAGALTREYSGQIQAVLTRIVETQTESLETAADLMARTIQSNGLIYAFGSGHSQLVATEFYYRAGGLACCDIINEKTFGRAERLPGYASVVLDGYPISSQDLMIVISHSGRNPLPVEMAQIGQERGIKVIGITSLEHSRSVAPRGVSGKHLFEVCDVVIDSCCPAGDALIEMKDGIRVGAASTLAGVFIAQTLVCLTARKLEDSGVRPPVLLSMNLDEGDRHNQALLDKYCSRVRGL